MGTAEPTCPGRRARTECQAKSRPAVPEVTSWSIGYAGSVGREGGVDLARPRRGRRPRRSPRRPRGPAAGRPPRPSAPRTCSRRRPAPRPPDPAPPAPARTSPTGSQASPGSVTIARSPASRTSSSTARRPSTSPAPISALSSADVDARARAHRVVAPPPSAASSASGRMPVAHPSGRVASAPEPHTRHPGSAVTGRASQVWRSASCTSSRPTSGSPMPVTSLTASVAMTDPMLAHTAPEDAAHGARRHGIRRRLVREDAGVARPLARPPHRDLAVEAVDRPPHVRHAEPGAGVADEVAGREVVGAVEHEVVVGDHVERGGLVEPLACAARPAWSG